MLRNFIPGQKYLKVHTDVHTEVRYLMEIKEEKAGKVTAMAREVKTSPWTTEDLTKVLKFPSRSNCRDPHTRTDEMFKPGVVRTDLQLALLDLFNIWK